MLKKSLLIVGVLLVFMAILAACAPATPAPTEAPVATATVAEPTAVPPTAVPTAVPTVDPAEAIKPIFAASPHADAKAMAFTDWDTAKPQEVPAACARCHTSKGFQEYIANGKVAAGIPAPAGTLECATCHNDTAQALTSVTFPSGVTIDNLGKEAICMTCHQGRESKVSVDQKITSFAIKDVDAQVPPLKGKDAAGKETTTTFGFTNVHYFAAGGTLYAGEVHMGYEYDGKVYDAKTQHVDGFNTCLGCHDQHSQQVKVDKCAECHEGVKTVDDLQNVRMVSSAVY
jgi:formylmethanofuran dehydrogenase subunit E